MNNDSTTYFQRIWYKIKRVLTQPEDRNNNNFSITNEGDNENYLIPNKKVRYEAVAKSLQDSFDQAAFMEVMKKLLTCSVCLEVRKQANQCQNGHLICINCTLCIQQSSSSNKDIACPVCRVPLTGSYQRSLLAEQLISELPTQCRFCHMVMSGRHIQQHEMDNCICRIVDCQYTLFGCTWKGIAKEKSNHELICHIGLSCVSTVSDVVNNNMKKQLKYYERRNLQWNNLINKLRERNGFKILLKQIVVTKYKSNTIIKTSYKTTKLQIVNHTFLVKFKIKNDSKLNINILTYKLIYTGKDKVSFYFFLNSLRYDDDIYELADNLHYFSFDEKETIAGAFNITISRFNIEDENSFIELLKDKESLYFEMILNLEINDNNDNSIVYNTPLDNAETITQAINSSRNGLPNSNAGNLVVALISSNSLQNQSANEEETEDAEVEEDNNDDDEEEGEAEEEEAEEEDEEGNDEEEVNDENNINENEDDNETENEPAS